MAGAVQDPTADIKAGYFQECDELLEELADGMEALRQGSATQETFNAVFRAVHSIKGGAAAFVLSDLADFAHSFEARLMEFRDAGALPAVQDVPPLERAADRLAALVTLAAHGKELSDEARLADAAILGRSEASDLRRQVKFTIDPNVLDVVATIKALAAIGTATAEVDLATVPGLDAYDPERVQTGVIMHLETELSNALLRKALTDIAPGLANEVAEEEAAPKDEAPKSLAVPPDKPAAPIAAPTIRVGLDRIDRLINLVGELVINQAMLTRSAEEMGAQSNSDHMLGLDELMRLTRDLQDSVMQIRAQPVKPLFQRMARICREASSISGKSVVLVSEGQDTEIDKTVIERLADPLTHMIRNAVDHAMELPEARLKAGKAAEGTITLRASHRSGQVILEVIDDGTGIDREKVLARAKKRGVIPEDAELQNAEIDQLLFLPGFSTATEVSSLSGRGVGMDVVRTAIHGLGGRIAIESQPGQGTRFEIALPLTLAVLDAMIISVASETLVVPLSTIQETLTIQREDVLHLTPGQRMLRYNGRAIALTDLGEELGYHNHRPDLHDCVALIIEPDGQPSVALAIDEIHEQRQVVIKGLQKGFAAASSVAAATILGDGRIALIIDPYDQSLSPVSLNALRSDAPRLELSA